MRLTWGPGPTCASGQVAPVANSAWISPGRRCISEPDAQWFPLSPPVVLLGPGGFQGPTGLLFFQLLILF